MSFKKITEQDYEEGNYDELLEGHADSVQRLIDIELEDFKYSLCLKLLNCESPIEQEMAINLHDYNIAHYRTIENNYNIEIVQIEHQPTINVNGKKYRADFGVPVWDLERKQGVYFIIECDGHDFHEKTKEQATRDKRRDRELTEAGYVVMRYTGSEIYNNYKIGKEVFDSIVKIMLNRRNER